MGEPIFTLLRVSVLESMVSPITPAFPSGNETSVSAVDLGRDTESELRDALSKIRTVMAHKTKTSHMTLEYIAGILDRIHHTVCLHRVRVGVY